MLKTVGLEMRLQIRLPVLCSPHPPEEGFIEGVRRQLSLNSCLSVSMVPSLRALPVAHEAHPQSCPEERHDDVRTRGGWRGGACEAAQTKAHADCMRGSPAASGARERLERATGGGAAGRGCGSAMLRAALWRPGDESNARPRAPI